MGKKLPKGQDLIILAREYSDDEFSLALSSDFSYQLQIMAQQDFMKIVNWLKEKGY